jgi:hypothetical protein
MANRRISDLTALTTPAGDDYLPIVDVSEVSAASRNKRITVTNLFSDVITTEDVGIVTGTMIASGTITDANISATAEIAVSKLADGTARQLLQTDAAGTGVEWTSNVDLPGTLDVTGAATFDNNVTIQGDLTVNGTTTTIDTTNLIVEDKNIEIGKVATPTDVTADGGGITLKGTTDKTINWVDATDAWTFSEHVNLASSKEFRIAGAKVLDATSLGSAVISSSLTSVGTIGTGTWNGATIGAGYGGTGQTSYTNGQLLIGKTDGSLAKATLTASTGVTITNGDGTITISATGSGGTVTAVTASSPLASSGGTTPDISIQDGTTAQKGAVQLEDSTSSTSTTKAATPNSVKSAYDLAAAALPKAGGTVTGNINLDAGVSLVFEGATANDFETTLSVTDPTADRAISLPDASGTVALTSDLSAYAALDTAQTWTKGQRGEITALTDGATITPDFADSNNFSVTLGGNRTLANPTNLTAGQSGCIWITQDGTGSRTLAYGSYWDFTGGTAPTLTTTASAVDCLVYAVQSSTKITATLITNLS